MSTKRFFYALLWITSLRVHGTNKPQTKYCNICPHHTMCLYKGPAPGCGALPPITDEEKIEILDVHNSLRSRVARGVEKRGLPGPQPPAGNMREMMWDKELAEIAQRWSDQCSNNHDKCRNTERFNVGQNRYSIYGKPLNWTKAISDWFDEVEIFDYRHVQRYTFGRKTGHYTQVVWGDTYLVGCGKSIRKQQGINWTDVNCNYGPAGNFLGHPMYKVGGPCTACPKDTGNCKNGLCVPQNRGKGPTMNKAKQNYKNETVHGNDNKAIQNREKGSTMNKEKQNYINETVTGNDDKDTNNQSSAQRQSFRSRRKNRNKTTDQI